MFPQLCVSPNPWQGKLLLGLEAIRGILHLDQILLRGNLVAANVSSLQTHSGEVGATAAVKLGGTPRNLWANSKQKSAWKLHLHQVIPISAGSPLEILYLFLNPVFIYKFCWLVRKTFP